MKKSDKDDVVLSVEDVSYRYGENAPLALKNVNLSINRGEFIALAGQNGAGKTTLAKLFNGLLRPTEGRVTVEGYDTRNADVERLAKLVGYCYQNPDHQIFASTVKEEVAFGPKNLGVKKDEIENVIMRSLELVGLEDQIDESPFMLGRGERQKLAVASILAMESSILIIDEPTTGMDLRASRSIMSLLRSWHEGGRTIVVITHDMNIIAEYVPTTVVMSRGKILAKKPTREVMTDMDLLERAFLKPPQVTRLASALEPCGVSPGKLTPLELVEAIKKRLGDKVATKKVIGE